MSRSIRSQLPGDRQASWKNYLGANFDLYLMVLPGVLYYLIFHYAPMLGLHIAFRDYVPGKGMWGSNWVGMKHFMRFFNSYQFWPLIGTTVWISV